MFPQPSAPAAAAATRPAAQLRFDNILCHASEDAADLAAAPTAPAAITLHELAAQLREAGGGKAASSAAAPVQPQPGSRRGSGGSAAAAAAGRESPLSSIDALPTSAATTPAHSSDRRAPLDAGEPAGFGSFTLHEAPAAAHEQREQQQQPEQPRRLPYGLAAIDPFKLFPSPFASTRFPTGGWPIYLMKLVIPPPWAADQGPLGPTGGLKISVKPKAAATGAPAAPAQPSGLRLRGLFGRRKS